MGRSPNIKSIPPTCKITFPCRLHNTATTKQIPFGAFIVLVSQGYFFSASVAFVSALAEILVVVLAATPFSPGEIFLKLIICAYTSTGILSLMVIVLVSLVFWRKHLQYLSRTPDTLGGVMSYICGSRMLVDLEGAKDSEVDNWRGELPDLARSILMQRISRLMENLNG